MRKFVFLLVISFMLTESENLNAQQSIVTNDLAGYLDSSNEAQNRLGFPWNGCHEFEIEVSVGHMGVGASATTTVIVCCVRALCITYFENQKSSAFNPGASITVSDSSTVILGGQTISVANGVYPVNDQGEIANLKYEVTTK